MEWRRTFAAQLRFAATIAGDIAVRPPTCWRPVDHERVVWRMFTQKPSLLG